MKEVVVETLVTALEVPATLLLMIETLVINFLVGTGVEIKNKQVGVVLLAEKGKEKNTALALQAQIVELGAEVQEVEKDKPTKTDEDNFL